MILNVMEVNLRRLLHSRVELLLTFVVPIAFFSIFALIFGGGVGSGATPKIKVVAVDEADTEVSRVVVEKLKESAGLRFMRDEDPTTIARQEAREMVKRGSLTLAIVIHSSEQSVAVDLLADSSDQVASQVVSALVAKTLMIAQSQRPPMGMPGSQAAAPRPAGNESDSEAAPLVASKLPVAARAAPAEVEPDPEPSSQSVASLVDQIEVIDVMGEGKSNPVVSMYAAGIAVMFLLFGATGGGGALLEERENKTLDRLLSTRLSMDHLLLGKWFYMTLIGVLQVTVMFGWAQLVFGVDVWGHLDGFAMMTIVTSLAASAFGLFLATLCKTRGQLNGLSVILVLSMSALGGSMVPRYVMSETLQQYGLWTFNAWALDGYDKVFWRELPVASLSPQLSVLMISALGFLLTARLLAVQWETN